MKSLLHYLHRSYPYFYGDRKINAIMFLSASAFVLYTMLFVRPDIIVSQIEIHYVQAGIAYACITFITAMLWAEIPRAFFRQSLADWRLYKELILTLSCILMMGMLNYVYIYVAGHVASQAHRFVFADMASVVSLTFLSGLTPLMIITLIRLILLERSRHLSSQVVDKIEAEHEPGIEELHANEWNETFGMRLNEVSMIESMGNYVKVYQVINQVSKVTIKRTTMKRMEELLADQQLLIRIHRLYFANISHVHKVQKDAAGNLSLLFENEKVIRVSRNKRKQVSDLLKVRDDCEQEKFAEAIRKLESNQASLNYSGKLTDIQRVLSEEIDKFKLIAENVSDVVCLHEPREARYVYVSPSCKDVTGYLPVEMEGKSPYDFFHPDMIKELEEDHRRKEAGEISSEASGPPPKIVYLFKTKDRGFRWMESHSRSVFDKEGNVILILSTSRDVHEREEAEKEKQRLLQLLSEARK